MLDRRSSIAEVRKVVTVETTPQHAFELFTAGIQEWWPLATFSVGEVEAVGIAFGKGVGDAIIETLADGTTAAWGTVTRWEPPHRVAYTWHPGNPESEAGLVEVSFTPDGSGRTVVELVHGGWDRRPDGAVAREGYDKGWNEVLNHYVRSAVSSDQINRTA